MVLSKDVKVPHLPTRFILQIQHPADSDHRQFGHLYTESDLGPGETFARNLLIELIAEAPWNRYRLVRREDTVIGVGPDWREAPEEF